MTALIPDLNVGLGALADRVRPSLVKVEIGNHGGGSGVVWDSSGLIVTNAHVASEKAARRGELRVVFPGGHKAAAKLITRDAERDVAALRVDFEELGTGNPVPITTGDSRGLLPGQWVLAMGHPWGVAAAATAGIVIGSGNDLPEMPKAGQDWIAVGLSLRPGHSGGPLVDAQGRMIGMNTMLAGLEVGLAVPVHVIEGVLAGVGASYV